ncbi:hypothetical protein [Nocardia sp. Marseille-Q1738]
MHWGVVATVSASSTAALAAVIFGWLTVLRAQYERVLNVVDYISSDRVAEARHQLGSVIYDRGGIVTSRQRRETLENLFVVLWAARRVAVVRETLPRIARNNSPWSGPHRLLRKSTEDWVKFWVRYYEVVANETGADTAGSDRGLIELAIAWGLTDRSEAEFVASNRLRIAGSSAVAGTDGRVGYDHPVATPPDILPLRLPDPPTPS